MEKTIYGKLHILDDTKRQMESLVRIILLGCICLFFETIMSQPAIDFYQFPDDGPTGTKSQCLLKDSYNFLWIGKPDELLRFDGLNYQSFKVDENNAFSLKSNNIYCLFQDTQNRLWIGTRDGGLHQFDYYTEQFYQYPITTNSIPSPENYEQGVRVIFEDDYGNIWIGTENFGLQVLDESAQKFSAYFPQSTNKELLFTVRAALKMQNGKNQFWVGSKSGLYEFNSTTKSFLKHSRNLKNYEQPGDNVYSLAYDSDSTIFTGGWGNGLSRYNFKKGTNEQFLYREILNNSNIVFNIIPLNQSEVLLGTIDRALIYYNLAEKDHYWYAYEENAKSRSYRGETYETYVDDTGRGWMAQVHGLSTFRINGYDARLTKPYISKIMVNGSQWEGDTSLYFVNDIQLKPKENNVSIHVTDFNFEPGAQREFAHKLEGKNAEWVYSSRNVIRFESLKGGTSLLKLKVKSGLEEWSPESEFALKIKIPFWKQAWFIILSVAGFIGLVFIIIRYRINSVRKEERLKARFDKQLAEVEMQALRAQMNPHFMFNCLNSINNYIVENKPEEASEYLTKFSWLIRMVMQNSRHKLVPLDDDLEALELYIQLESQRFDNKFSYSINKPESQFLSSLKIPPLLLQPYVENAIWHGLMHKDGEGKMSIDIKVVNGFLKCIVEDDGIGRKKAADLKSDSLKKKKSMGMQLTKNRIDLVEKLYNIRADVEIVDLKNDAGTRVIITLPTDNIEI